MTTPAPLSAEQLETLRKFCDDGPVAKAGCDCNVCSITALLAAYTQQQQQQQQEIERIAELEAVCLEWDARLRKEVTQLTADLAAARAERDEAATTAGNAKWQNDRLVAALAQMREGLTEIVRENIAVDDEEGTRALCLACDHAQPDHYGDCPIGKLAALLAAPTAPSGSEAQ